MASLKKGHHHGGSAPTPTLSMKRQSPTGPAAPSHYTSAIATLGDSTMNQACALLLSERDYSDKKKEEGAKTDLEKMLALYEKAVAAVAVIDEYIDSMPTAPQLVPSSSRAAPVSSGVAGSRALKPQGGKVIQPSRRTSLAQLAHRGRGATGNTTVRPAITSRQTSDSSAGSATSSNSRTGSSKKQRLNPSSQQENGRRNPPQSAVAFLQALNSKKSGGSGSGSGSGSTTTEDTSTSPPRRSSPRKVQPRRSARNR